ncbi:MAG: CehA/McbA family metallohydrolase [Planctomycetia bacterium]|nr:CehA/McbA family metallohydrolase [Planctomycetia bacterium]
MRIPIANSALVVALLAPGLPIIAAELEPVAVEGQPLAANVARLVEALGTLGAPLPQKTADGLAQSGKARDAAALQRLLDPHVLFVVSINPESRVKVDRGPAPAALQQAGFTPVVVKIVNQSTVTKRLGITSPQSGPVYAGVAELSMKRQQQEELRKNENRDKATDRFLHVEMFAAPPMTANLSGLTVEYAIALIYSSEAGKREATIGFDVAQGNQDLGFRGEVPVLFDVREARRVSLAVRDWDGAPTTAKLLFRDAQGHVFPPQPKRLAPDFFFQPHIYRANGENVLLPPGRFKMQFSRGPEYRVLEREITVPAKGEATIRVDLERWINPMEFGFFNGDHHIHAAGCAHYTSPTQGVTPADMFLQVKGEGLNVGCVLTWGPCYDHQRQFFAPTALDISEPRTLLKYDLEISGFGSQALGHVCLLNLKDQTYPGSEGTSTRGWPTWTTPVLRWAKEQGGVTGYAHSASGMQIDPPAAAKRLIAGSDRDKDGQLSTAESAQTLLPDEFAKIDTDGDGKISEQELTTCIDRTADELPNLTIPEMNGVGAMEFCVSTAEGVCDFLSAMDTARIQEWNCWYHVLNCGFPLKVSGETDFPCMSSRSVGQGRVYVQLGQPERVDFVEWCKGLGAGRSYVSDGYAHAVHFDVEGKTPGTENVALSAPARVKAHARVSFAPQIPKAIAYGTQPAAAGRRIVGDTVLLHGPRGEELEDGGMKLVELIVNGNVAGMQRIPADGKVHDLQFDVPIERSSWVALRQFPQLHTNPVNVIVAERPIRASRKSAQWCIACTELLWKNREKNISPSERNAARETFQRALERYRQIAAECAE